MDKAQLVKFIRSFAGHNALVRNNQNLEEIIDYIIEKNPAEKVNEFISELHTYAVSNIMMPFDFRNIIKTLKLKADSELLCEKLMCLSLSLCVIKTNVIQTKFISPLQDANNNKNELLLRKSGTIRDAQKKMFGHLRKKCGIMSMNTQQEEKNSHAFLIPIISKVKPEDKSQIQSVVLSMADIMFERKLTVSKVLLNNIEDKVIDGCEYQLIKRSKIFA
jgi:hypothetical protein